MTRRVTPEIDKKLRAFNALFLKWNKNINLSAARTAAEIDDHIDDSLALLEHLGAPARLLDVGSGGGFPAVTLASGRPDIDLTAREPVHKKHAFLRTAAREL